MAEREGDGEEKERDPVNFLQMERLKEEIGWKEVREGNGDGNRWLFVAVARIGKDEIVSLVTKKKSLKCPGIKMAF